MISCAPMAPKTRLFALALVIEHRLPFLVVPRQRAIGEGLVYA